MPNLCICTDLSLEDLTGGADRIISLAKNVSRQGFNVYLIDLSLRKSFRSLFLDNDRYYQIENGISKERQYPISMRFLFPGFIKLLQEILNRMVSLLTFSSFSAVGVSYLIDPYLVVKLFFVCRKQQINLVQCECTVTAPSAYIVKKLLNIPLVYDAHNVETEMTRSMANASSTYIALLKLVEKTSCMVSDSVFVVSEIDKKILVSWGILKNKIDVIPNSVDVTKFSTLLDGDKIRKKYNLVDKIVMIFHGTLNYPPNQEAAMILANNILPRIVEKYPNVCLMLVGKNPPKITHPSIIATGFVKNLDEHIAAADIGLVPLLKGGGTRIKILEYMASGKSVVSTLKGAEGLNLQNGADILMTEYPDSKFVDLVLKLIADSSLRRSIGINAKKKTELLYDWAKTAEKAVKIYSKLVCVFNKKRHGSSEPVACKA
jgi:glycosyltransferase involved in cell wall biosynthesis